MRNAILAALIFVTALLHGGTASADSPALDKDVLSSVVTITINGKFAGTGVVVTEDGLVLTSYEFAPFAHGERIVVESDLPRAATVVMYDPAHGIAVLQMHGVIPRPARVVGSADEARGMPLAVYRTAERSTLQIELQGAAPLTEQAFTPVFSPKSGKLARITVRRTASGGPRTYGPAFIRKAVAQAKGDRPGRP